MLLAPHTMPDPELVRRVNSPYAICLGVSSQNSLGIDMAEYQDFILAIVSAASGGGDGRILRYVLPCTKASPYVIVECSSIQTALELLSLGSLSVRVTEDQDPVTVLIFPVEQTPFSSILCPSLSVWHEKFGVAREEVSTLRADLQISNQSCEDLQREIVDLTAQMNTLTLVQSEVTLLQSQLAEANSYVAKVLSQLAEEKSSHEMAVKSREDLDRQLSEMTQLYDNKNDHHDFLISFRKSTHLSYPVLKLRKESIRKISLNLRRSYNFPAQRWRTIGDNCLSLSRKFLSLNLLFMIA